MSTAGDERLHDERQGRPEHVHKEISPGDAGEGELTAAQRRIWEERAASFDEHADPGERERREAARQKSQGKTSRE